MLIEPTKDEAKPVSVPALLFLCTECECPVDYEWVTKHDVLVDRCDWDCNAPVIMTNEDTWRGVSK